MPKKNKSLLGKTILISSAVGGKNMVIEEIGNLLTRCTGCGGCIDICSVNALEFVEQKGGFLYPNIKLDKCINCNKCVTVCPVINQVKNDAKQQLFSAIAKNRTDRLNGSSGGVFGLLANYCLANGYYVCGAVFEEMKLMHKIINNKNELPRMLKSKYIQSNMLGIFNEVKTLLKNGNKVLFCGTPCQVSALKNSVNEKFLENLLTVDIICHGVPSQKIFDLYIKSLEKKHNGKIQSFDFRVKDNKYKHAHGFRYVIKTKKGEQTINGVYTQSPFYNAFKKYIIFREGCYNCEYATLNRVADITLGDFWGIEKYQKDANTDRGVSMVIVNTERGNELLYTIQDELIVHEYPLEYGVKLNHCLTNKTTKPKFRDVVIDDLSIYGYDYVEKKYFSVCTKHKLYWLIPPFARNIVRKLRGK